MKTRIILLAGTAYAFAALLSTAAMAQDRTTSSSYSYHKSSSSHRDDPMVTEDSGIYLGAYGGYGWTDADVEGGEELDVNGADYGLLMGYQIDAILDQTIGLGLHGAIEGFYGWSGADDDSGGVSVEKDHEWGINFRPGLAFLDNNGMGLKPYGILGYRRAEFETNGDDEDFDGFELGIGTELVAYNNYGVRLDYSHVFYEENNGVDPDENDLRLGVAYHF